MPTLLPRLPGQAATSSAPSLASPRVLDPPEAIVGHFRFDKHVLAAIQTDPDPDGYFNKIRVVKTDFKYPLVRVKEKFWRPANAVDGDQDRMVGQTAMIADHLIVQVADGFNEQSLSQAAARYGAFVRRAMTNPGSYLVAFEGTDPGALDRMMKAFREEPVIGRAEPDYLVHPN